ncbi:integrin beta-7 isoform X2 [Struthio camelus]|uniref:integrin beta-7 isoform X2 n=1 Tax=Struthio camelus TaxID=8801 RepID=UPI003603B3E5
MARPGGLLLLLLAAAAAERCLPRAPCDACIRSHPECAWCEDPEFTAGGKAEEARCGSRVALEQAGCPHDAVVEPRGHVRVLEDVVLGPGGGGAQLGPRSLRIFLRPGEEQSFQVRFQRAEGHPVDLYYLMDLSYSMKDDLENVRKLGSDLLAALRNVTSSVRIGFGSFVDKTVLPYVSTVPSKLRNPCPERHEPCDPPAAFRHVLSLTANASEFASRVSQQRISGNLDSPEGGFDAIMQVAVCEERIGWRPVTRLLVFASDDTFHTAGDGKLGGIFIPSDSRCHLDASGVYSKSHLYDYPSVGHLAQVLSAANIQPIFAVTGPTVPVYQELSRLIPKSVVGELREDSSNVVQLISDAYNSLSSTVELQHSPLPPGVSLSYESHCGGPPGPPRPHGGLCSGVRVKQQVNFTVRVRADGCLAAPQAVALRVLGFAEELRLELRGLCACPCAPRQAPTPLCHGGSLECGVCRCPAGRRGRRCECEGAAEAPGDCRPPNSTGPPCGGRGRCVCGVCECPPGLSGPQCQCDSSACERHDGLPCGGPERGECVCGTCRCRDGFTGSACGCSLERAGCLHGERECGGHGRCVCGRCHCQPGYLGPLCTRCPSCQTRCQRHRDCADCRAFGLGPLRANCSLACNRTAVRVLRARPPRAEAAGWCTEQAADGRILVFDIEGQADEDEDGDVTLAVWVEEAAAAAEPVKLVAGLVAGIVAAGLLLAVLYRVSLEVYDRREYRRFEEERRRAKWNENNPLFKSATTTTVNPNFVQE